jgi:hypothetical protein
MPTGGSLIFQKSQLPIKKPGFDGSIGAMPFEARLTTLDVEGEQRIRWSSSDLKPPMLLRAAELFGEGLTVREVAATLRISKSEAGRLRIRASEDGLLSDTGATLNGCFATVQ